MNIKNQIFLSFTTKEEYEYALRVWKWNMRELVTQIRGNKFEIKSYQTRVSNILRDSFFRIEESIILSAKQNKKLNLSKIAREMLEIRAKMKKLAGKQMEERIASEATQLVGV